MEIPITHSEEEEEAVSEIPISAEDEELLRTHYESTGHIEETEEISSGTSPGQEEEDLWQSHLDTSEDLQQEEEKLSGRPVSKEDMQLWQAHAESLKEEETVPDLVEAEGFGPEEPISFEDVFQQQATQIEEQKGMPEEKPVRPELVGNMSDADQYIAAGKYLEAMNIYKDFFAKDPDNKQIIQRIEELKALLKLLGKDKEALVMKLESFLEEIKKRRNELFGST